MGLIEPLGMYLPRVAKTRMQGKLANLQAADAKITEAPV
jgi:hypothetical protein